ncbi:MAG: DUF3131 domain-containing protein [Nitrososphaerales archaeon]
MKKTNVVLIIAILLIGNAFTWTMVFALPSTNNYSHNPVGTTLPVPPIFATGSNVSKVSLTVNTNSTWAKEWIDYAKIAWQYYTPGFGVSSKTGLVYASQYFQAFTDWDLAGYVQAILSAEELGIIGKNGTWGADYRLNLVLNFLNHRQLMSGTNIPFQFYDSNTEGMPSTIGPSPGDPADEGRLLIALYDARMINPELTAAIDSAVNYVNYSYFLNDTSFFQATDVYPLYCSQGFALWGFNFKPPVISPISSTGGAPLDSYITPEPVILSIVENVADNYMIQTGSEVYSALYKMYNNTGEPLAFGEGGYPSTGNYSFPYVYEGIQLTGSSYKIVTWQGQQLNVSPETFTKTAFALLAIYNSTYGSILVNKVSGLSTSDGYSDGFIVGSGQVVGSPSDNTNNMIMEAAAYAIFSNA